MRSSRRVATSTITPAGYHRAILVNGTTRILQFIPTR